MASLSAPAMARSRHAPSFQLSHCIARYAAGLGCGLLLMLALWLGLALRSEPPSAHRIVPGLDEPLVAGGPTASREDAVLDAALQAFREAAPEADFPERAEPLIAFVDAHPHSPWRTAVLVNLGMGYYRAGYFTQALSAWDQAWQAGRSARDPAARALADRAAGELARMHARLGHADALQALLQDIADRPLTGPATELITGAREGLWAFRNDHGKAYLCGPMALRSLLDEIKAPASALELMNAQRSGPQGFDLAQLSALASNVDLSHRLVYRAPGDAIPVPSVVHWKLNHYAAIVAEQDGRYLVKDPTFASGDAWLTRAAIDAEASGYVLVPDASLSDASWRTASLPEAQSIRGMGYTTNNEPGNTLDESAGLREPTCNRMCEANAKTLLVSLSLSDVPVGYTPPKGPPVQIRLSYHQRESGRPAVFGFFNIGPKWGLSVQSWIEDDPARAGVGVVRHAGGGGFVGPLDYIRYDAATGAFTFKAAWAAAFALCLAWLWFAARPTQRRPRRRLVRLLAPIAALALVASCGGGGNGGFWFGGTGSTASADGSAPGTGPASGMPMGPSGDGTPGAPPRPTAYVTTYGYDALDRLLSASSALNLPGSPASVRSYGYDAASNLTAIGLDGTTLSLEATNTNALAKGASYDASGNPLTLGAAKLAWDGASRLVTHEVNNGDSTFVHDGLSRIVRIVERQGGQVVADKAYLWCGLERCLERDNLQAGSPITKRYFAQGVVDRGSAYYYVTDHLGSVRQLVDAQGSIQARYDFDAYGNRTKLAGHADADMSFAGLLQHERSGLDLAVYRGYDQQRGRWLNRDPMGEEDGPNLYGYVGGNPLRYTDRQGLFAQVIGPAVPILGIGCALTPGCRDAMADAMRSCGSAAGKLKDWLLSEETSAEDPGQSEKLDREQKPDGLPTGTKPIDKDKRVDRGLIHDIKKGLGAKDWVGIDPEGNIWINEGGQAAQWGHMSDWNRSDKRR